MAESPAAISGRIFGHWNRQKYRAAYELAVYALDQFRSKGNDGDADMNHDHWWEFMTYAIESVRQMPPDHAWRDLLERARGGKPPFEGYDVAYTFVWLARWAYQESAYEEAENLARVASQADGTWGYPELFRGWMALVTETPAAKDHLKCAVRRDPRLIFQIMNNEVCQRRPDILAELRREAAELDHCERGA